MSKATIGSLRVNLALDSAKFERGAKRVNAPLARMRTQFLAVAGVAAAMGAAISKAALAGAQGIDEAAKAARRLDGTVAGFEALKLAAGEAGVRLSSIADDVQTLNRELSKAGDGGAVDKALRSIGLAAADLDGLDVDERLATIADAIKAAGLNAGQASAVLQQFAVRNREMALLVLDGGDALRAARKDVADYGLALSEVETDRIEVANDRIGRLGLIAQYAGQQLALELVPSLGRMAVAMTDSLREGGALRIVLDGLTQNIDRIGTYLSVAVTGFGVRFVGAMVVAKLATVSLSGALLFLRGALIRTGIGALIVGAGELVFQFTKLVRGAGGFAEAMGLLKDVAIDVWDRIKRGGALLVEAFEGMGLSIQAAFANAFAVVLEKFADLTSGIAKAWNDTMGLIGIESNAAGAGAGIASDARAAANDLQASADAFNASVRSSWDDLKSPLDSVQKIRDAMRETTDATNEATDAAENFNKELADETSGSSGAGGAQGNVSKLTKSVKELKDATSEFEQVGRRAFVGLVSGAKSWRDALSEAFASLSSIFANRAFDALRGGSLFGGGGGFFSSLLGGLFGGFRAKGGPVSAGKSYIVGEEGPEVFSPSTSGSIIPNGGVTGLSGGPIQVELMVSPSGEFDARVASVSQAVSVQVVQQSAALQQGALGSSIEGWQERGTT